MNTLLIGQPVANLTFVTTENARASFGELQGKIVIVYFYPKDNTPGCTIEAKNFRDLYPQFLAANAYILGVSKDNLKSHDKFKTQCELPFPLVSDEDGALGRYFNVLKDKSLFGKHYIGIERSTFLIDKAGILRQEWRNVKVLSHAKTVLQAVQQLNESTPS